MKRLKSLKFFAVALVAAMGISSCGSDDGGGSNYENLALTANANGLTTFIAAADAAGPDVSALLTGNSDYTVFAPTNAAFDQWLGANGYPSVSAVPQALLRDLMLNHFLSGSISSLDMVTKYTRTLAKSAAAPTSALNLYMAVSSAEVKLNGVSKITTFDIRSSNGRIHIIDKVIPLPTIVTHLEANPELSGLRAALATYPNSGFIGTLSGTAQSPFTVFAPTNAAMTALLNEFDADTYADIPEADLAEILSYHVIGQQNYFNSQLLDGTYPTLAGQSFTITNTGGGKKITDAQGNQATVTTVRDVQATNGIIHVVDKALLPNL